MCGKRDISIRRFVLGMRVESAASDGAELSVLRTTAPDPQAAVRSAESAISHSQPRTERRARVTAASLTNATQSAGTADVLACGKHARRRAAWATPRTGDRDAPLTWD
jgi:hypothetical protein